MYALITIEDRSGLMNEINELMEQYIRGTCTGDVALLRGLFHEKAVMSGDLGPNKLVLASPEIFFSDIDGYRADSNYSHKITMIDVAGETASVTLQEYNLKDCNFKNFFQLQLTDGKWKIISKLFTTL